MAVAKEADHFFSLYAPILLIAANLVLSKSLGANHPGAKAFALVSVLMIAAGFYNAGRDAFARNLDANLLGL